MNYFKKSYEHGEETVLTEDFSINNGVSLHYFEMNTCVEYIM